MGRTKANQLKSGRVLPKNEDDLRGILVVGGKADPDEVTTWICRWRELRATSADASPTESARVAATSGTGSWSAATGVAGVGLVVAGILWLLWLFNSEPPLEDATKVIPVAGHVRCLSGADVTGVWVHDPEEPAVGEFSQPPRRTSDGDFVFNGVAPARQAFGYMVGCGGTRDTWRTKTATREPIVAGREVVLVCNDQDVEAEPPYYGACSFTAGSVLTEDRH